VRNGTIEPERGGLLRGEYILSRALYRFKRFSLTGTPPAERNAALNLKIAQWSPYPEHGKCVAWVRDQALVWVWDKETERRIAVSAGSERPILTPETLLHLPPASDGAILRQSLEGVEGQIWRDGLLESSYWWPKPPSAAEWVRFQRGGGCREITPEPTVEAVGLSETTWARKSRLIFAIAPRGERWMGAGLAAVFGAIFSWQAVDYARLEQAIAAARKEIAAIDDRTRQVQIERREAIRGKETLRAAAGVFGYPAQLELFAAVGERLPRNGAQLVEWEFENLGLRFAVEAPRLDAKFLVTSYQSDPRFTNVAMENTPKQNQILLKMNVRPSGANE